MSSIKSVLPDAAYQKFIRLRVAADELNALAHSTKNRIGELEGAMNQTSDPAVYASLKAQVSQARESMSSYQERHRTAADLLTRIENYMRAQRANTQFTMARVPQSIGAHRDLDRQSSIAPNDHRCARDGPVSG